jgi:hypothetical protein
VKLIALVLLFAALGGRSLEAAPFGLMVPAYFYPGALWDKLNWTAGRCPVIAIMNPNSGPDVSVNSDYTAAVTAFNQAGGRTIGYVYTSYGARDIAAAKADIDRYFSFYPVSGIFLDEMANDATIAHLDYYSSLYQYIHAKGTNLLVAGNPGINTLESYLARPCADVLVTYESASGYSTYQADAWTTNHLARHFCHLPYSVPTATVMSNCLDLASARNAGWVYVTDDGGSNPYDSLPAYWTNEVEYARLLNQFAKATRLSVREFSNAVSVIRLSGAPGVYQLESSTNLAAWSPALLLQTTTSNTDITVSNGSLPRLFFRSLQ